VISDTVNTGIYVLEPEVLKRIPDDEPYDFATQLFPAMLAEGCPLYGYIADGYWCDVGNLPEYLRANADLLSGLVNLPEPLGEQIWGGVWTGQNVEIAPDAQLYGPIYLGNSVKIKGGVSIHGPAVIRDYTVIDNYSRIEHSVLWRNTYVGEACELRGVIVGRQCSIKSGAVAYEGAVIGDSCVLDENCVIHADVKLWPNKEIEPGATVRRSIIWGSQGRRSLFGKFGVTGVVNVDLTPEFAAKLGSALGAALPQGSYVAVNRDAHRSSRMLKRAMISGLPSAGVHVWDLGTVPIPVARHFVRTNSSSSAGVHVRLSPFDQRVVDVRLFDAEGMNQSRASERSIERIFFREDFRRAYLNEIGRIDYATNAVENYKTDFLSHINQVRIRNANLNVIVDYSHGLAADTLSSILSDLTLDYLPLNALMDETKLAVLRDQFNNHMRRIAKIISVLQADVGIKLDVGGEKIFLVDEKGRVLDNTTTSLLMAELTFYANPEHALAIPVTLPKAFDTIAGWHRTRVIRTKNDLHHLMSSSTQPDVMLALDGTGNFIFPDFQPAVDGLMTTVRLLEYLAVRRLPVSEIVSYLPRFHMAQDRVDCPWESKGAVMRTLNHRFRGEHVETIDGLKIHLSGGEWIHIAPNPERPYFELRAEAEDIDRATDLVVEYSNQLKEILEHH
jgi:mannose-1-phosphate guanylyltransferase / phosphomannomutase